MKAFNLPSNPKTLIFDIDSTLYTNAAYAFEQVDCQVRQFARDRGITADEARHMVADYRRQFAAANNGKKISLGNTLLAFGIPIAQSVEWRKTLVAIGISDFFPEFVGLDTCLKSKPAVEPFMKACEITNTQPKNCIAIGDRYDMDIALPLELGMGGILVTGVEEVYGLEKFFNDKSLYL